ncbi:MAG: ATP-binding protein [Saccharofermentanales bacterium]
MKNDITKKIAHIYQDRRFQSADLAAARREDILNRHPVLRSIEEQLTAANARIASQIIADGRPRSGSPERDGIALQRSRYLSDNNIPEDYDRTTAFCPKCSDTGFENGLQGKKCSCYNQLLVPLLFEYSNFSDLRRFTFDNYDSGIFSPEPKSDDSGSKISAREQMQGIRNAAIQFIRDFDTPGTPGLFFIGKPGTGKTFIAGCIANELINAGRFVLYLSAPDMYEHINEYRTVSNSFSPDKERLEKAAATYESIMDCDLLVVDDLGTETFHANRQPELLSIINHRSGTGRKMIITTNLDMSNLLNFYDERLISRVYGNFSVIKFIGDDLRLTMRRQKRQNVKE